LRWQQRLDSGWIEGFDRPGFYTVDCPDACSRLPEVFQSLGIRDAALFTGDVELDPAPIMVQPGPFDGKDLLVPVAEVLLGKAEGFLESLAPVIGPEHGQLEAPYACSDTGSRIPLIAVAAAEVESAPAVFDHVAGAEPVSGSRLGGRDQNARPMLIDQLQSESSQSVFEPRGKIVHQSFFHYSSR